MERERFLIEKMECKNCIFLNKILLVEVLYIFTVHQSFCTRDSIVKLFKVFVTCKRIE